MLIDSIRKNIPGLHIIQQIRRTDDRLSTYLERLSSGLRINKAKDNPGGLSLSSKLETQFRGLNVASENVQTAVNMADTATEAMDEIVNLLNDIREIALDASSGGGTASDQASIREKLEEISVIAERTRFGNKTLLDGAHASSVTFAGGTRVFGGEVSFGPNSSTLFEGSSFLSLYRVQSGSERISSGGDGAVHTGIRLSTDIAVSVGQFAHGATAAVGGDLLRNLTFNRVSLANPGRLSISGVLADGSTAFSTTVSITPTATVDNLVTAIQSAINQSESSIGINSVGGTNALETNIQYDTTSGRLEFYSGQQGVPSEFSATFSAYKTGSTVQTTFGTERISSIANEFVSVGSTGAKIGNSLTAITGSTFATGSFNVQVSSVQSAAQRRITADEGFFTDVAGTVAAITTDTLAGTYFGGIQIANGDTLTINGTDPDGTTFSTVYTIAGAYGGLGTGQLNTYQELVNELQIRDRTKTAYGFNGALVSLASGYIQLQDDVAASSSTNLSFIFTDTSTSTTVSSDAVVNTAGNRERASISLAGGDAVLVEAGEVVTLEGGNPVTDSEPTPQATIRFGSGLTAGSDTLVITEQVFAGKLNSGAETRFRNGQQGVTFTSGSGSVSPIQRYQTVSLDFDSIVDITSTESSGGEVFELTSSSNQLTFQIGSDSDQSKQFVFADLRLSKLGLSRTETLDDIDVTTVSGANEALDIIDAALDQVNETRSRIGAFSSRLENTLDVLDNTALEIEGGYNSIVSADVAEETTNMALATVLLQAQTAVLLQATTSPVRIFEILYGLD